MSKGTDLRRIILGACEEFGLFSPEMMEPSMNNYLMAEALAWAMVEEGVLTYLATDLTTFCLTADLWRYRALGILVDLTLPDGRVVPDLLDEGILSFRY